MTRNYSTTETLEPSVPKANLPRITPSLSGERRELGNPTMIVPRALQAPASAAERDAILESLYVERRRLTRAKRLGDASSSDEDYLAELNEYIDVWEGDESRESSVGSEIWQKLDMLASSVLSVQATVEKQPKK